MPRNLRNTVVPALFVLLLVVSMPVNARAQGFISPFIGYDFGGDSGCPSFSGVTGGPAGCEDKNSNIGVSFGSFGNVLGFEAELGYARNFFGETPEASSSVLTFMSSVMLAPKIGPVRPYALFGIGLIKTHTDFNAVSLFETDHNNFGWDFGGGLMVMFGDHIGVRGDIRRFSTFEDTIVGFLLSDEKLNFHRASAALVLAF